MHPPTFILHFTPRSSLMTLQSSMNLVTLPPFQLSQILENSKTIFKNVPMCLANRSTGPIFAFFVNRCRLIEPH